MSNSQLILNIVLFFVCLPLVSCITSSKSIQHTAVMEAIEHKLDTGDTIRLNVFGHEKLSGDFQIGSNGKVSFPLILDIKVSGLTIKELKQIITDKLSPKYLLDPKVSIDVVAYRDIYILGEVRVPGKYAYIPNMTLLKAVAIAGGHTYRAKENSAKITRQSKGQVTTETVGKEALIYPGDTVIITRRWF